MDAALSLIEPPPPHNENGHLDPDLDSKQEVPQPESSLTLSPLRVGALGNATHAPRPLALTSRAPGTDVTGPSVVWPRVALSLRSARCPEERKTLGPRRIRCPCECVRGLPALGLPLRSAPPSSSVAAPVSSPLKRAARWSEVDAMDKSRKNLLYLFELPHDPISLPRGGGKIHFDLENDLSRPPVVATRLGGGVPVETTPVPDREDVLPQNLGTAASVPIGSPFSFFIKSHRQAAKDLCDVFMRTKGAEDLLQVAARVHGQVNETLFIYALSFVILRKKELRNVRLPSIIEVFPGKFIPQEQLMKAQLEVNRTDPNQSEPVVVEHGLEFSGTHLKPEHRLAYWREDYGINAHHWHWHLVYPIDMGVNRDRKGELFFYMHQQMVARYDMERLSLGLPRVQKLENWRAPIEDGYFPKLTVNNSGRAWGSRQDDTVMQDFLRNDFGLDFTDVTDLEIWRSRLFDAIHQGFMIDRAGKRVVLSDDVTSGKRGIDILGDALEADSNLSVNSPYYGDLHNMGHVLIAFSHDPTSPIRRKWP
ncbi:prophenoloxidase-2 [Penaeus vannamei]|uniref:Prophenoloxidase-2 n=1 Tax=Penaeus vannamei TaxID=6689 RepID=A0A3R7T0W1_PENVA|nr:prophenoloxidase-2 [Penaeus vannamei]